MDLVALLLIASLVTAIAGVVLAGFVFVPWLIALVLLLLLVFFLKPPVPLAAALQPNPKQSASSNATVKTTITAAKTTAAKVVEPKAAIAILDVASQNTLVIAGEEPELIYRGTKYHHHTDSTDSPKTPEERVETYVTYRGSRCKTYSLKVKAD
jgi:hypothetical protein